MSSRNRILYESFLRRAKSVEIRCDFQISKNNWKNFVISFFTDEDRVNTSINKRKGKGFNPQRSGASRSLLDCYSALLYYFGDDAPNIKEFMLYCKSSFVFSWCTTVNRYVTYGYMNTNPSLNQYYLQDIIKGYEEANNAQSGGMPIPIREKEGC